MAETSIEWADYTFNPWIGCTRVSPACDHCYAASWGHRFGVEWGPGKERRRTSEANWKQPLAWNRKAERDGTRPSVFCASLADIFDQEVPDEWRHEVMALIRATPSLIWLLLTKRPKAMADWSVAHGLPENVWAGTTVEDQKMADLRIPELLRTKATKRFLSMEPLLEQVDVSRWLLINWQCSSCRGYFSGRHKPACPQCGTVGGWSGSHAFNGRAAPEHAVVPPQHGKGLDWVIAGGESGPDARPSHPDWFRSLRDQCQAAGVPFLFKQWGGWGTGFHNMTTGEPVFRQFTSHEQWVNKASTWVNGGICLDRHGNEMKNGGDMAKARDAGNFPVTIMHNVGKKAAGRLLDGRTHDEFPVTR